MLAQVLSGAIGWTPVAAADSTRPGRNRMGAWCRRAARSTTISSAADMPVWAMTVPSAMPTTCSGVPIGLMNVVPNTVTGTPAGTAAR